MLEEISHLMLWRNFVYPTYGKHFCILRNGEFFFYILCYGEHLYILRYGEKQITLWRNFIEKNLKIPNG